MRIEIEWAPGRFAELEVLDVSHDEGETGFRSRCVSFTETVAKRAGSDRFGVS